MRGPSAADVPLSYEDHKSGKLGYVTEKTKEQKTLLRVQKRILRRHQASTGDFESEQKTRDADRAQAEAELAYINQQKDEQQGLQGDHGLALKRDYMSINESQRDHYRKARSQYSRHKDEKELAAKEDYLVKRAGPGDRSLFKLDQEKPIESSLSRNGMMLVPTALSADTIGTIHDTTPIVGLAYDAHDTLHSPSAQRVDRERLGGPRLDAFGLGETPSDRNNSHNNGRPGSRESKLGSMRPSSGNNEGRGSPRASQRGRQAGPGASLKHPGHFPPMNREEKEEGPTQVEVEPSQKWPMWTS
jgi:hypothetical protein